MRSRWLGQRTAFSLVTVAALATATGCGPSDDPASAESDLRGNGSISRLFDNLTSFFSDKSDEDVEPAPIEPYEPPIGQDPGVDELFETMGLTEVAPPEDLDLDGSLVGVYEYYADPDDPNDFDDEICFFSQPLNGQPTQETMFWAEMFGFRADQNGTSDIHGQEIGMEVVGGVNEGGDETRVIFYVNGIRTDWQKHCDTLQQIANLTGAVTIGVLNETDGTAADVWQTAWDRFTITVERKLQEYGFENIGSIHDNQAATVLMNAMIHRIREGKHVEIWAHSQGGAVTSMALHRALRTLKKEGLFPVIKDGQEYPEAIKVKTFGSASPKWVGGVFPEGPSYEHFVHLRDATPSVLGIGAFGDYSTIGEKRAGENAKMVFFDGEPPEDEYAPSNFELVDKDEADIGFTDLRPKRYHRTNGVYLKMYAQQYGSWTEGTWIAGADKDP